MIMTDLQKFLHTTPKYVSLLNQWWIYTPKDFFQYFPREYEDRGNIKLLNQLLCNNNQTQITKWKIKKKTIIKRWSKKFYEIIFEDKEGWVGYAVFFNSAYIFNSIKIDSWYLIIWKPQFKFWKIQFLHPDLKESSEELENQVWWIQPIYSELLWIKPSWFAKKMKQNFDKIEDYFDEYLPDDFLQKYDLLDVVTTIKNMHFPQTFELQQKAVRRIFFDRLLRIQLYSLMLKKSLKVQTNYNLWDIDWDLIKSFVSKLPFELTNSQKKVIKQIIEDFHSWNTMMRLLQWDVWSGKTIVAVIAIYYLVKKFWWQVAFLVPLSVLAKQHFINISKLLLPEWIYVELLSWEISQSNKQKIKQKLENWQIQVVIGTHALIQEDVKFKDLKFVIIDEQHKFWVKQRAFLKNNWNPHILQMSATPIPRSLALAFFGEFDISTITELPSGRKPIITKIIRESDYKQLVPWILQKIQNWQKLFVIAPLIEESEKMQEVQSAINVYEQMKILFNSIKDKIWLLHWKMSAKQKQEIMEDFKSWKYMILVSTTVIEVWVDIKEATMMIILNAERFGLSQLHQLRGRIWRNDLQSYCFLQTKSRWWDTYKRLKAMEQTNDWFRLAELDLQYRGSWEILWHKQSWEWDIPFEILSDFSFLEQVQKWAQELLEKYPNLDWLPWLKEFVYNKIWNILV